MLVCYLVTSVRCFATVESTAHSAKLGRFGSVTRNNLLYILLAVICGVNIGYMIAMNHPFVLMFEMLIIAAGAALFIYENPPNEKL